MTPPSHFQQIIFIFTSRDHTVNCDFLISHLAVPASTLTLFPANVWVWGHKDSWALKNWCFQIVVVEETLESPLDYKEIKAVNSKGNQLWILTGRTDAEADILILRPLYAKSQLIGKHPDSGKDGRQKEKVVAGNEMVGWHHWLNGHEFE